VNAKGAPASALFVKFILNYKALLRFWRQRLRAITGKLRWFFLKPAEILRMLPMPLAVALQPASDAPVGCRSLGLTLACPALRAPPHRQ
jgi:hypothetical protein